MVDKRRLLEIDEQRRQAEQDKMAAIRALEVRARTRPVLCLLATLNKYKSCKANVYKLDIFVSMPIHLA